MILGIGTPAKSVFRVSDRDRVRVEVRCESSGPPIKRATAGIKQIVPVLWHSMKQHAPHGTKDAVREGYSQVAFTASMLSST